MFSAIHFCTSTNHWNFKSVLWVLTIRIRVEISHHLSKWWFLETNGPNLDRNWIMIISSKKVSTKKVLVKKYSPEVHISRDKRFSCLGVHCHTTDKYSSNKDLACAEWALQFQWGFRASLPEPTKWDYGVTFIGLEFVIVGRNHITDVFSS